MKIIFISFFFLACGKYAPESSPKPSGLLGALSALIPNGLTNSISVIEEVNTNPNTLDDIVLDETCKAPTGFTEYSSYLYLVCSLNSQIHIFNRNTMSLEKVIVLENNLNPYSLVIKSDGVGYLSSYLKDKIVILNLDLNFKGSRKLGEISLLNLGYKAAEGSLPRPQGVTLVGQRVFVAINNSTPSWTSGGPGYVVEIDSLTNKVVRIVEASKPNTVSLSSYKGKLYIANAGTMEFGYKGDGSVDIFDLKTNLIEATVQTGEAPGKVVLHLDKAFVSNAKSGSILRFDLNSREVLTPIDLTKNKCNDFKSAPFSFVSGLTATDGKLFASEFNSDCFFVYDVDSLDLLHSLSVGDGPGQIYLTR